MKFLRFLCATNGSWVQLFLRVGLGVVMFPHGAQKALGWWGGNGFGATMQYFTESMHIPAVLAFLVIAVEFGGSIALVIGFLTRLAALGVGSVMTVAMFLVHLEYGFFMNWQGSQKGEGFEYHLLAITIAIGVLIGGAGRASVDRWISCKPPVNAPLAS